MRTNTFYNFEKAKEYMKSLGLRGTNEWNLFCSSGKRPSFIPSNPNAFYKENGWNGMADWMGFNKEERNKNRRRYKINDNFFKVWSHDMAYILGFWWADGWMWVTGNSYVFGIGQKESYILYKILKKMKCRPQPVKEYNDNYKFAISSKEIVNDIIRLGGLQNKSLIADFPNIPNEYLADFIRGYFDGDGCIYYNKRLKFYQTKFTCGSKIFITKLHQKLKEHSYIKGGSIEEVQPRMGLELKIKSPSIVYQLHFSSEDTIYLANFIYNSPSTLRLKRKFNLIKKAIKINPPRVKKMYTYDEIKELVLLNNIKSFKEYNEYRRKTKDHLMPVSINTYGNDYEGKNKFFKKFLDFEPAKEYIREKKIKSSSKFRIWAKTSDRPSFINSNPNRFYRNSGWVDWNDFLGINYF